MKLLYLWKKCRTQLPCISALVLPPIKFSPVIAPHLYFFRLAPVEPNCLICIITLQDFYLFFFPFLLLSFPLALCSYSLMFPQVKIKSVLSWNASEEGTIMFLISAGMLSAQSGSLIICQGGGQWTSPECCASRRWCNCQERAAVGLCKN